MTQCELCGASSDNLVKTKVSGAELMVCSDCTSLGTKMETSEDDNKNTKYSTGSSNDEKKETGNKTENNSSNYSEDKNDDPFDGVDEIALNFGEIIRDKRNELGLDRDDLSDDLGIKKSYLENIENEDTQPSVKLQNKIEKRLNIDLSLDDEFNV